MSTSTSCPRTVMRNRRRSHSAGRRARPNASSGYTIGHVSCSPLRITPGSREGVPSGGGHRRSVRGRRRRGRRAAAAPGRQAGAGHVPGGGAAARCPAGRCGGVRGLAGGRRGGPCRPLRVRGRGRRVAPANVNGGWVGRRGREHFLAIVSARRGIATKRWVWVRNVARTARARAIATKCALRARVSSHRRAHRARLRRNPRQRTETSQPPAPPARLRRNPHSRRPSMPPFGRPRAARAAKPRRGAPGGTAAMNASSRPHSCSRPTSSGVPTGVRGSSLRRCDSVTFALP
jgi:hypothetical protein